MGGSRTDRINEEVKRELSAIIRGLKDPRISGMTSVVAVDVSKDMRWCKVYVSVMGGDDRRKGTVEGLKSAAGFIRREIGERLALRFTPEMLFTLDDSIEHGARINDILGKLQ